MSKTGSKKERAQKSIRRRIRLVIAISVLVLLLLFLLLFKVDTILVSGNERYTDEEIKALCINEEGYNNSVIYYLFHQTIRTDDVPLLDYIDTVYVDRQTIQLRAHEKLTIGMFRVGDKVCCIDQDGIVIEILDFEGSEELNLPLISGLGSKGTVGEKIELEDDSVLNALSALKSSFDRYGITPEYIYLEKTAVEKGSSDEETEDEQDDTGEGETQITYVLRFGNVRVLLGPDENLEEKMRRVAAILPQIQDMMGELHLENYNEDTENIIFDTNVAVE